MNKLWIALATVAAASTAFAQTKWDLPTGYAVGSFQTENVQLFANDVDKATAGKLKITLHASGSLYKANEIKRAVQTGQTPAGEFLLSGAANENALFGVDSIPFLATNYLDARKLYTASKPALEKLLASQGIKLMFSVPWPGQSLYSVKEIKGPEDLKGTKMRAYNPATTRIAQMLKAQPTTIQLAELGQALATGTVENFLTSSASGVENKLFEQTKFFYPVNAWLPRNATVVSQKAFDALDKPTQEAVLKAASAAETRGWAMSERNAADSMKALKDTGAKIGNIDGSLRTRLDRAGSALVADAMKGADPELLGVLSNFMGSVANNKP